MDTLRQRENMEILDVFKNLHSQVNALTRKQVQAFPESLKPKTQRDLTAEVGVDKAIETLNKTIEQKLGALEFVVQTLEQGSMLGTDSQSVSQSFQATINTGDLVPLWNSIVRSYKEIGLSRESQNIIKVKIQDLLPNLDAMCYGLKEAIEYIFQQPLVTDKPRKGRKSAREKEAEEKGEPLNPRLLHENLLVVLDYLRTLSLYQLVKEQAESGNLELLSVPLMNSAYENIFNTLSNERIRILKEVAPRGVFGKSSIRNIPLGSDVGDYKQRLDALSDELGVDLSRYYDALSTLPNHKIDRALNEIRRDFQPLKDEEHPYLSEVLARIESIVEELRDLETRAEQATATEQQLEAEIEVLRAPREAEMKEELVDEIEEPVRPEFRINDYGTYEEILAGWEEFQPQYEEWAHINQEYYSIKQHNAWVREQTELLNANESARQEALREKEQELREIKRFFRVFRVRKEALQASLEAEQEDFANSKEFETQASQEMLDELVTKLTQSVGQRVNRENLGRVIPRGEGKPKGKSVDTRGMATLRKNYGYSDNESSDSGKSDSESDEEDPLHFDDRRNDNYSMKPAR
jgi:hypothetical protein